MMALPKTLPEAGRIPVVAGGFGVGAMQRPKRGHFYPHIAHELGVLCTPGDPQRKAVYRWQRDVLSGMPREQWLGAANCSVLRVEARSAATTYIKQLWVKYTPLFSPYFFGVPRVRIGFAKPQRRAHARIYAHDIYCNLSVLYRSTLVHEVCHLLSWRDHHGPLFCSAIIKLWEGEFGIERERSLRLACEHGVEVA